MLSALFALVAIPTDSGATYHSSDANPAMDPMRPVTQVTRDGFSLQYFTNEACPTLIELREGEIPRSAFGHRPDGKTWTVSVPGNVKFHRISIAGLKSGRRYYYRVLDPGIKTARERNWGADDKWRREYAVSTLAPKGKKTIIHLPVKVLLMPNVVNVASATADAPTPPKMTEKDIQKIKDEFAVSSRFFWVNSGMRLWVDYHFFVDDRWQRWSPEPENAADFYKGWPASRSYPNKDFDGPGGGDFTILDTRDPLRVTKEPVIEERPYSGQIEMAWTRRWNPTARKWEFYNSGGGTFGVDSFPQGFPGRSQFLGGGDTAWLATHEFHHNLESHGAFSLSDREDDRIVFNHYAPRQRTAKPDGSFDENPWTTAGRHGEHWDGMAFWDRQLTDAQWLRMYFGYTLTVDDRDMDGLPDDNAKLPLDERRFGSSSRLVATDGQMNDLRKAMLSTWVPGPLQPSWIKPAYQGIVPNPQKRDQDGDNLEDLHDPYPLYPNVPLIPYMRAAVDGDAQEWVGIPAAASFEKGGIRFTYRQAHDETGFYGLYEVSGPWKRIDGTFDGEGDGVYSGSSVLGFQVNRDGTNVTIRPTFNGAPGLRQSARLVDGVWTIEFKLPNRGEGPWFWNRGGREIGTVLSVWDMENRGFSAWEPYRPFYARMVEPNGQDPMPSNPPAELTGGVELLPDNPAFKPEGGWKLDGTVFRHTGDESPLVIEVPQASEFDLYVEIEAKADAILGAFTPEMKEMNAGVGYIAFVGGYANTVTRLRLFGKEEGDGDVVMTPGIHRIQMTRRGGEVWLLIDGKPVIFAADPAPKAVVDRLAILGGYGGAQTVHRVRYRVK